MKYTIHTLTASILISSTFAFALAENNSEQIKLMISEIQNASEETRFEKVNAFKQELRTMNAQSRQEALGELHAAMSQEGTQTQTRTRTQTKTQSQNQEGTQTKTQTRTQNRTGQSSHIQNQNMQRVQQQNMHMNQQNQAQRMQGIHRTQGQGKQ